MNQLFFDSSTGVLVMALAKDGRMIDYSIRVGKKDHAKYIVDRIDQMLKRKRMTLEQINQIIVGYGPGSYTGIRIAVMVAKMLAYTKKIELRSVSSLYFLTSGLEGKIAPMMDARNGNVFTGIYENQTWSYKETLTTTVEIQAEVQKQNARPYFIDDRHYEIDTKRILEQSELVSDIHHFVPQYLRITEAERNLQ